MGRFVGAKPLKGTSGSATGPAISQELGSTFPALVEYLTVGTWEDGSPREVATLLCFAEGPLWKLCLNDRSLERSCWSSGTNPLEMLRAMEQSLSSGEVEWRVRVAGPSKKAGRG